MDATFIIVNPPITLVRNLGACQIVDNVAIVDVAPFDDLIHRVRRWIGAQGSAPTEDHLTVIVVDVG
jgi:hypothetical protein